MRTLSGKPTLKLPHENEHHRSALSIPPQVLLQALSPDALEASARLGILLLPKVQEISRKKTMPPFFAPADRQFPGESIPRPTQPGSLSTVGRRFL